METSRNISYYRLVNGEIYNSACPFVGPDGKLFLRPHLEPEREVCIEYREQSQRDTVYERWTLGSVILVPLKHLIMPTNYSKIHKREV